MKHYEGQSVQVLGVPYQINEVNQISKDELVLGIVDYINQEIKLDANLEKETKRVALFHEVIHTILFACGLNDKNEDENLIQALAMGLNQVLDANKGLFFT